MKIMRRSKSVAVLFELIIITAVFAVCLIAGLKTVIAAQQELEFANTTTLCNRLTCEAAERFKAGESIDAIVGLEETGYTNKIIIMINDGKTSMSLTLKKQGGMEYLDIMTYDKDYLYTEINCARIATKGAA